MRRTTTALPALVLAVAVIATVFPLASVASASHDDCGITASGPFFYAGIIFPSTVVECETAERRIRIETSLSMDGVEVNRAGRVCRNSSVCYLTVDAHVLDRPGSQVWCTSTMGWIQNHLVGHASSCETGGF